MVICGASKACINPELPISISGYGPGRVATRIHDDINVAALYLKDSVSDEAVAVLSYDMPHTHAGFIAEVQQRCAAATGMPKLSILTSSSHSHSSPTVRAHLETDPHEKKTITAFYEMVVERSVEALTAAIASAGEATVSYNTTRIRENMNRRVFFPDGRYFYQPRNKNLLPIADGPVDDELGMIYF